MKKLISLAVILLVIISCSQALYKPTTKNVDKVEKATLAQLNEGYNLYKDNCGKCHKLYKVSSRDARGWKQALEQMHERAGLTPEQSYTIYSYLVNK